MKGGTLKEKALNKILDRALTQIRDDLTLFAMLEKDDLMGLIQLQDDVDEGEELGKARFERLTDCVERSYSSRDEERESQEQEYMENLRERRVAALAILNEKLGEMLSHRWTMSWAIKILFKHRKYLKSSGFKELNKIIVERGKKMEGNQSGGMGDGLLVCIAVVILLLIVAPIIKSALGENEYPSSTSLGRTETNPADLTAANTVANTRGDNVAVRAAEANRRYNELDGKHSKDAQENNLIAPKITMRSGQPLNQLVVADVREIPAKGLGRPVSKKGWGQRLAGILPTLGAPRGTINETYGDDNVLRGNIWSLQVDNIPVSYDLEAEFKKLFPAGDSLMGILGVTPGERTNPAFVKFYSEDDMLYAMEVMQEITTVYKVARTLGERDDMVNEVREKYDLGDEIPRHLPEEVIMTPLTPGDPASSDPAP